MAYSEGSPPDKKISNTGRLWSPFTRIFSRSDGDSSSSEKAGGSDQVPSLTIGDNPRKENIDRGRDVNSLPPWIHSLRQGENVDRQDAEEPLLSQPPRVLPARHNHTPADPRTLPRQNAGTGRVWNHARTKEAVVMPYHDPGHHSRWQQFALSSTYARDSLEESELVGDDWLEKNMPELNTPWEPTTLPEEPDKTFWLFSPRKRMAHYNGFQRALMKNPFVPAIIRMIVLFFSLAALGIGVKIWQKSSDLNNSRAEQVGTTVSPTNGDNDSYICKQQTSTYMAFIVNSVAPLYLLYVTYDEYIKPPLGLRRSATKLRLLFLDLVFIVFAAANLSLAFNTLTDQQWSCFTGTPQDTNNNNEEAARSTCVQNDTLCARQGGLVAMLCMELCAWLATFAISIFRYVQCVQGQVSSLTCVRVVELVSR